MTPRRDANVRLRRLAGFGLLAALLGLAAWQATVHASAWSHFTRGKAALDHDDPAEALRQFDQCLETWTGYAEGHFLAARAARRSADLLSARRHLDEAARLGWDRSSVELEEAMLQARSGDLAPGVHILLRAVQENHPDTPEILPILVPAFLAEFRLLDAAWMTARWVELCPESPQAWAYHADVLERLRQKSDAVDALRRLVKLTPDDRKARLSLARLLIELRQGEGEAAEHLEWLTAADPKNPAVAVQLAACRELQGRTDDARATLDRLLTEHPRDAPALHLRGRLELNHGHAAVAVGFLRRAAEVDPSDRELLYSLFLCLQQVGTPAEVREAEERWKRCDADLKRVGELGKVIATAPDDPDPRREIGEIFLRNGREPDGLRWLDSALQINPNHGPTHRVLAAYYERTGRPDLAARHRAADRPTPQRGDPPAKWEK
jgi:tetratricopeptide (TPR) repeat protein